MSDFGDDEYKHMVCVEAAAIEKQITLKPGEEWTGKLELSAVPSSYYSGQLDPDRVIQDSSVPEDSISQVIFLVVMSCIKAVNVGKYKSSIVLFSWAFILSVHVFDIHIFI
jgi:hypothetical protein